jgi:L-fuculose-phosphate aldolase
MTGADRGAAPEARAAVAAGARAVAAAGLVSGSSGNVSLGEGDLRAITPGGAALAELQADEVVVLDAGGELVWGEGRPSSEAALHRAVAARTDAAAVVHTHSHFATVLSCSVEEVPAVHYLFSRFGGPVRVAPYERFGSEELAGAAAEALRDRRAALLGNHGAVTVADTVPAAVALAELLEWACSVAYHALALGEPRLLSAAELAETARRSHELRYGGSG